MRLNLYQLPDLEGSIANNGRPHVFIDGGPTYDEIIIETDLVAADILAFVVEVNGDERVRMSGVELQDVLAYDGRAATSGQFVFSFVDAMARQLPGEAMTGLCTKPTDRVKLTLELNSADIAGTETVTLYALTSPTRPEEFRLYSIPESIPITKTGDNDFTGFERGKVPWNNGMGAKAIRRVFGYGAITHMRIEQDDRFPYGKNKLKKAVNDAWLKRNGKTVPTSSTCFVFDPVVLGNAIADLFDTFSTKGLRFTFTTSNSTDLTALTQYVERIANPVSAA